MKYFFYIFIFSCFYIYSFAQTEAIQWYDNESRLSKRVNPYIGRSPILPKSIYINCTPYVHPTGNHGRISGKYGWRSSVNRMHRGIDISLPVNTSIYSPWDGVVRTIGCENKGYGKYIVIRHTNGLETVYGHLNQIGVKIGEQVQSGAIIGWSGNTGRSTGPHLHFETRYLGGDFNPSLIIDFRHRQLRSKKFLWTKNLYNTNRNSSKVYRLKADTTLEELCSTRGWDLEELCLLNGLLPDLPLKKGRLLRVLQ